MNSSKVRTPTDEGAPRLKTTVGTNRTLVLLISLVIFAPTALFALSLRPAVAALTIVGCVGAAALIATRRQDADPAFLDAPIDARLLAAMIAAAAAVLLLGGALHLVYAPSDWRTRDAVLADIVRDGLPVLYAHDGVAYLLRAPLGMYMLPGLAGRICGLMTAHVVLWVQNSLLLGAVLYMFARIGRGWVHAFMLLGFAGCSTLGALVYRAFGDPTMAPRMAYYGLDAWNPYFQFSGSLVQLFWAPNHALPAWWLATLVILQARRQVDLVTVGASVGGAMFWSPLAILPVAAWVAFQTALDLRRTIATRRFLALALVAPCFLPTAIYMLLGASSIAHANATAKPMFGPLYLLFLATALVPALYLLVFRRLLADCLRAPALFSVIALAALPLYAFGPGNDLVMYGAISPLVILAFAYGSVLLDPESRGRPPFWIGMALLVACLPSAVLELSRPAFRARYAISDCSLFEANAAMGIAGVSTNYVVDSSLAPGWLIDPDGPPRRADGARSCWSDGGEPPTSIERR